MKLFSWKRKLKLSQFQKTYLVQRDSNIFPLISVSAVQKLHFPSVILGQDVALASNIMPLYAFIICILPPFCYFKKAFKMPLALMVKVITHFTDI